MGQLEWTDISRLAEAEVIECFTHRQAITLLPTFVSYNHFNSNFLKMRVYSRLLAVATDAGASRPFRPAPAALLPPIPLYRRLLRSHRKRLGLEERLLGDMYVKAEFRAHKDIDNPVQIVRPRVTSSNVNEHHSTNADWLFIGVATVLSDARGRLVARSKDGQDQD